MGGARADNKLSFISILEKPLRIKTVPVAHLGFSESLFITVDDDSHSIHTGSVRSHLCSTNTCNAIVIGIS